MKKIIRFFNYPFGINSGMIRNHITCQSNTANPGTVFKILESVLPAQLICNNVVVKRISRRYRTYISCKMFYFTRCAAPLPYPYQPQSVKIPINQHVQLLIGNLVKPFNFPFVFFRQLMQPDINIFCDHYNLRNPVCIFRKLFIFKIKMLFILRKFFFCRQFFPDESESFQLIIVGWNGRSTFFTTTVRNK